MADWRVVWCPNPYCIHVAMGAFSPSEEEGLREKHKSECDGLRFEREVAVREAEMRMEGRWQRVARRWGLLDEPEIKIHAVCGEGEAT